MDKTVADDVPTATDGQQNNSIEAASQPVDRTKGIPNASLKKFLELQKRREDLSRFSQFKLSKIDHKKATRTVKKRPNEDSSQKTTSAKGCDPEERKWEEVRQYFDVNAHLTGPVGHGIREPKSGLEEKINTEVKVGNFDKAEELSNTLAERELAVRINDAFGAKRYAEAENVKKETMLRKRQKRIPWGFETKERWEMKGNM